jgi:Tyrosyl-DNA phosphodiesterase
MLYTVPTCMLTTCASQCHRGNELAWALVTSHNLSKAAWGALQVSYAGLALCCSRGAHEELELPS